MGNLKKKVIYSWVLWFIPIIPAMWEAKIRRITVGGQSREKVCETLSQPVVESSSSPLASQTMQEAEMRRFTVPGQSQQKISS
jgi:hypothetical protein